MAHYCARLFYMNIKLKDDKKFEKNSHLGLFYAIVDIYQNSLRPINDSEMVHLLFKNYGLEVERRTIKRYRDFIEEYFDVNFIHKAKGHLIVDEKELERINDKKKIDILIKTLEGRNDDFINILYKKNHYHVCPLELNFINDGYYLLCAYQNKRKQVLIINMPTKDIKLSKPIYVKSDFDTDQLVYEFSHCLFGEIKKIDDLEPYKYETKIILKEDAPIKDIRKKAKGIFYDVKITSKTIDNKKYHQLNFYGDNIDIVKFVINNLKYIQEIKSETLKEELRFFLKK